MSYAILSQKVWSLELDKAPVIDVIDAKQLVEVPHTLPADATGVVPSILRLTDKELVLIKIRDVSKLFIQDGIHPDYVLTDDNCIIGRIVGVSPDAKPGTSMYDYDEKDYGIYVESFKFDANGVSTFSVVAAYSNIASIDFMKASFQKVTDNPSISIDITPVESLVTGNDVAAEKEPDVPPTEDDNFPIDEDDDSVTTVADEAGVVVTPTVDPTTVPTPYEPCQASDTTAIVDAITPVTTTADTTVSAVEDSAANIQPSTLITGEETISADSPATVNTIDQTATVNAGTLDASSDFTETATVTVDTAATIDAPVVSDTITIDVPVDTDSSVTDVPVTADVTIDSASTDATAANVPVNTASAVADGTAVIDYVVPTDTSSTDAATPVSETVSETVTPVTTDVDATADVGPDVDASVSESDVTNYNA